MTALLLALTAALNIAATTDEHVSWFPAALAGATLDGTPKPYDRETIFDYMDGKGEIYLTYSMKQVTTGLYKLGKHSVDVMIFDMGAPAEAFGIWSNIIAGEKVEGLQDARYDGGVLRGWIGPIFLDVAGEVDAPEVKAFAVAFAKALAEKVKPAAPLPALAAALPVKDLALTDLRFFHTDMCLSGIFYVSTQNVFQITPETDCMFADAQVDGKPAKVMLVDYKTAEHRDRGWALFNKVMFTDKAAKGDGGTVCENLADQPTDNVWAGLVKIDGPGGRPRLGAVFEAGSLQACQKGLAALAKSAGPGQ